MQGPTYIVHMFSPFSNYLPTYLLLFLVQFCLPIVFIKEVKKLSLSSYGRETGHKELNSFIKEHQRIMLIQKIFQFNMQALATVGEF